jgi:hypothetical protein
MKLAHSLRAQPQDFLSPHVKYFATAIHGLPQLQMQFHLTRPPKFSAREITSSLPNLRPVRSIAAEIMADISLLPAPSVISDLCDRSAHRSLHQGRHRSA